MIFNLLSSFLYIVSNLSFLRLPKYNEWSQCIILQKLVSYQPEDDEEVVEYLVCLLFEHIVCFKVFRVQST